MKRFLTVFLLFACVCTLSACKPDREQVDEYISSIPTAESSVSESESAESLEESESRDLAAINALRPDYDLGTCRNLSGDVSVVLFFMDDFESEWFEHEITAFVENEIKPGLAFLVQEAEKYGVELRLHIRKKHFDLYYNDDVIVSVKETGLATIDVLDQAARGLGYANEAELIDALKAEYQTEIVCLTAFDKNGTAYAINPKRGADYSVEEHCILFTNDLHPTGHEPIGAQASIAAHEMLHLFGAEDFYATSGRKSLAQKYFPNDLMLGANYDVSTNRIGGATAFYIGWTDEIPEVLEREDW